MGLGGFFVARLLKNACYLMYDGRASNNAQKTQTINGLEPVADIGSLV